MEKFNYLPGKWLQELEESVNKSRWSDGFNPTLIKCASLNNCGHHVSNSTVTDDKPSISTDDVPTANNQTLAKTRSDIKMIDTSAKLKLDTIEIDSQTVDETETLEEKAFHHYKIARRFYDMQRYEEALNYYNDAIKYYTISPLIYAGRAETLLKLNKPMNCIDDCSSALAIAPDHVLARKFRGRAHMLMGEWHKAITDLTMIDENDDDEVTEWIKKILPIMDKIEARNVHEEYQEDDDREDDEDEEQFKSSQMLLETNIEGGDNSLLNRMELEEEMQDPEVIEMLDKCPKLKKLFKKMMRMLNDDTKKPVSWHKTPLKTDDRWLERLRNRVRFENVAEDDVDLYDRNIFDEYGTMYPVSLKTSPCVDDLSD